MKLKKPRILEPLTQTKMDQPKSWIESGDLPGIVYEPGQEPLSKQYDSEAKRIDKRLKQKLRNAKRKMSVVQP